MAGLAPAGADRARLQRHLRSQPGLGRTRRRPARARRADRADQHARHSRLLPQPAGRGAPRGAGDRRGQPQGADGPVPLPDRRRRRGDEDPPVPAHRPRRPLPDRRRARAPRARHRRVELPLPVRGDRRGGRAVRLAGLGGLRIPATASERRPAERRRAWAGARPHESSEAQIAQSHRCAAGASQSKEKR